MRIEPGIVVDVDARKCPPGSGIVEDPSCHVRLGSIRRRRARPDPIVVRLSRQGTHVRRCRRDTADKQEQGPMKLTRQMTPQYLLRRRKAGVLVSMQQHGNE